MKIPHTRASRMLVLLAVALALPAAEAWSAGYEKATTWSGRYVGIGGAAASIASGSEAIYFNPAGLAGTERAEASLNLSPTFAQLEGKMPSYSPNAQFSVEGNRKMAPVAGTTAAYPVSDRFSVGLGFYVVGGMKAFYEDVSFQAIAPWATLTPTVKADLAITEFALGTAYQLTPRWKIGAAWRVVDVNTDFSTAKMSLTNGVPVLRNIHFEGMSDTRYDGVRLGVQYQAPDDRWGFGAVWRNEVAFEARGKTSGVFQAPVGGIQTLPGGTASIKNVLPQQFSLGFYYRETPELTLLAEYSWTEYSANRVLDVTGNLGPTSLDTSGDITQNWCNVSNIRLGAEYTGFGPWALRAGYVYTTRATPSDQARATFSVPGHGHTFTLGVGRSLRERVEINAALEYSFASGRGSNAADGITEGSFRSDAVVLHTGAMYRF